MKKRVFVRKLPAIIAAAGLLVSLSACAATAPAPFASCTPGANAALVSADGAIGSDPKAEFPTPLVSKKPELTTLEAGDGAEVSSTDGVFMLVSIYTGETGEALNTESGPLVGVSLRSFVDNGPFPFTAGLACTTVDSRFVATGTASELFGPESLGLDPEATLVVVADVTDAFPGKAWGADQLAVPGLPSVVLTPRGQPGFTFPSADAPSELKIAALKQGSGETVEDGDDLTVNITGLVWGASEVFASSFDQGQPAPLVATELNASGEGVVSGLAQALIGQQVGSQLLVVVPPSEGYPAGQAPTGVAETDTLVFVVDILAIG